MAEDLKFELFAHDLFSKIFFENEVRDKICDGREHYADECTQGIQDHQHQFYDNCYYQAVVCRQYFFRRIYYEEFGENSEVFTSSYSDFCDYIHMTCDRPDLFGHLHFFDHMLASCAFIADLCLFCHTIDHKDFIKIAHLCWALYFDRFKDDFYKLGEWKRFREVAFAYSLPFSFLTTHVEPKMTSSYMFVSLSRVHLTLGSLSGFFNTGLNENKTVSKNWVEYRRKYFDKFQFYRRLDGNGHDEPQNIHQAELFLMHLLQLCHPSKSINQYKGVSSSDDNQNYSSTTDEYADYFSGEDWESSVKNEVNKAIQLPKEKYLQLLLEKEKFLLQVSKKNLLQRISENDKLLKKLHESEEIQKLHCEYEDELRILYEYGTNIAFSASENVQEIPEEEKDFKTPSEPENNCLLYSKIEDILNNHPKTENTLQQISENKRVPESCAFEQYKIVSFSGKEQKYDSSTVEYDGYFSVEELKKLSSAANRKDEEIFCDNNEVNPVQPPKNEINLFNQSDLTFSTIEGAFMENKCSLAEVKGQFEPSYRGKESKKQSCTSQQPTEDSKTDFFFSRFSHQLKGLLSDQNDGTLQQNGNLKKSVEITNYPENICQLSKQLNRVLTANEGSETSTLFLKNRKCPSTDQGKDRYKPSNNESREKVSIPQQLTDKGIQQNKSKKKRRKNKRNTREKVSPPLSEQTVYDASEDEFPLAKYQTKSIS